MNKEAVLHRDNREFCYYLDNQWLIKLRTAKEDIKKVTIHFTEKWARKDIIVSSPMEKVASDNLFDYYEMEISFEGIGLNYCFELVGDETIYYGKYHFFSDKEKMRSNFFECPLISRMEEQYVVPNWAIGKTVYQIFPERFCNLNSPRKDNAPWDLSPMERNCFLGGTIKGITSKIDYLAELGVDVVYLCPIFKSISNHKYDTMDYLMIDPDFGSEQDFIELVQTIHAHHMYIMIDGVFNHCGYDFPFFQDVVEKGKNSKYYDWFYIKDDKPVWKEGVAPNYETFAFFGGMPKLNTKNEGVRAYIFEVVKKWMGDVGVDGFRLDVPEEYSHEFIRLLKKEILSYKKDAIMVGEVWHPALDYLLGDEFDSVMNYIFRDAVIDLFIHKSITPIEFHQEIGFLRGVLRKDIMSILWNILDSHDTARLMFLAKEDKELYRKMIAVQLSFSGMPFIYYGDCVGLSGDNDPDCRRGMLWGDKQDKVLFEFFKNLISIRKKHSALQAGEYEPILIQSSILSYKKINQEEEIIVLINLGDEANVGFKSYRDLISNSNFTGILPKNGIAFLIHQ